MTIQILGSGCPNCRRLETNAVQALQSLGIEAEIQKITDSGEIMAIVVFENAVIDAFAHQWIIK